MQRKMFKFEVGVAQDKEIQTTDPNTGEVVSAIIPNAERTAICDVIASSLTKTDMIKAVKEAGFPYKKGTALYNEKIEEILYVCDDKAFFDIAHVERVTPLR